MEKCKDCGIWKEGEGYARTYYARTYPSDCHDAGGHYTAHYDSAGRFLWTDAPWQTFPLNDALSEEDIAKAK